MKRVQITIVFLIFIMAAGVSAGESIVGLLSKFERVGLVHNSELVDNTHATFSYKQYLVKGHIYKLDREGMNREIKKIYDSPSHILFGAVGDILLVLPEGISDKEAERFWKLME